MKIRNGFVSNSSSSSFLIYGVTFENTSEMVEKASDKLKTEWKEYNKENKNYEISFEDYMDDFEGYRPYDDYTYLGLSWGDIKDDETGAQFKERAYEYIKENFNITKEDLSTHEECWHD